jgi:PIN domain nuclease of toxin-antitoxin system
MTYLDTHVAIWLLKGPGDLPKRTQSIIERDDELLISPIVLLELQNLHEIRRLTDSPEQLVAELSATIGLRVCDYPFAVVVRQALRENWTRDPFDRVIVAHARSRRATLITYDALISDNYDLAVW